MLQRLVNETTGRLQLAGDRARPGLEVQQVLTTRNASTYASMSPPAGPGVGLQQGTRANWCD